MKFTGKVCKTTTCYSTFVFEAASEDAADNLLDDVLQHLEWHTDTPMALMPLLDKVNFEWELDDETYEVESLEEGDGTNGDD